jgi:hypothetical protein
MDLFKFVGRGVQLAGDPAKRLEAKRQERDKQRRTEVINTARALWRNALTVDEIRGWQSVLEANRPVLSGLCAVLSVVAVAQVVETSEDDPKVRVLRGAISAIEQAGKAGSVITQDLLQAVASAARLGKEIVETCSEDAIESAAHFMHALSKHQGVL